MGAQMHWGNRVGVRRFPQAFEQRKDKVDQVVKQAIAKAKTDIHPEEPMVTVWQLFLTTTRKGSTGL